MAYAYLCFAAKFSKMPKDQPEEDKVLWSRGIAQEINAVVKKYGGELRDIRDIQEALDSIADSDLTVADTDLIDDLDKG